MIDPWTHLDEGSEPFTEPLTRREREILSLLNSDLTHREIADRLTLAPTSVKWYVQQVYRKLDVNNRRSAVSRGRELGWLAKAQQPSRPTGMVTFLFTDIEGSTRMWETVPAAMAQSFQKQEAILRSIFAQHGGYTYKMVGDAFQVAFTSAVQALSAAVEAQKLLAAQSWGEAPLRIRMALHTCTTEERGDDYVGPELNRVARLLACGHGGQVLATQVVIDAAQHRLPDGVTFRDLGRHQMKDIIEPEHVFQALAEGLPSEYPPLRSRSPRVHNLRQQHIPFSGRENELTELVDLVSPENEAIRIVTLTGPGGVGKTRLAMQTALEVVQCFSDGVYFVDLAPVNSLAGILETTAQSLGLQISNSTGTLYKKGSAREQLLNFLAEKELLLLMDNFEHLAAYTAFLEELLAASTSVKLLVTSRVRLNLAGEWVYPLEGLSFPDPAVDVDYRTFPSVQLFLDCARMAGLGNLQNKNLRTVSRICQLVEGLPLAIQLAASWVRMYTLDEIAAEIQESLDFLQQNQSGIPDRQQTIRATFEYSWGLLSGEEAVALKRLSVFEGGFNLATGLEVAGTSSLVVSSLMDKSLLRREVSGRFAIHGILHQYAREKLEQDPDTWQETRARHANYYVSWILQIGVKLRGVEQVTVQSALRAETRNLRLAWHWLLEQEDLESFCCTIDSVILLFDIFGPLRSGTEFLKPLLALLRRKNQQDPFFNHNHLLALCTVGYAYFLPRNNEETQKLCLESFQLSRELPSSPLKAYTNLLLMARPGRYLEYLGNPGQTNFERLIHFNRETEHFFNEAGDAWGIALTLLIRGDLMNHQQQDPRETLAVYEESLERFSELVNPWGQALCYHGMAITFRREGNYQQSLEINKKAMTIYDQYNNQDRLLQVRHFSGEVAAEAHDRFTARQYYSENRDYFINSGNQDAVEFYDQLLAMLDNCSPSTPDRTPS